ncbi:hypothetical protein PWT90_06962 [Aphanocladium album]|nr:hypothetical protein PWT90_06962 [Aphanocladium album]
MLINYNDSDEGRPRANGKKTAGAVAKDSEPCSESGSATQLKRQRKWAPRARTGCVSCRYGTCLANPYTRSRRIKCDEKKPACDNCTSKGRKCQGYEAWLVTWQPIQASVAAAGAVTTSQPSPIKTPFPSIPSAQERQLFFLFRRHFVVDVSAVFPSDFWRRGSLMACQEYPAAWHAALAIGAVYRSEQRSVGEGLDTATAALRRQERDADEVDAIKHCNKAMRLLAELRHGGSTFTFAQQEMVLVTCMLLNRYCSLRGQDAEALVHAKNGIRLLGQWGYWQRALELPPAATLPNCVAPLTWLFAPFMNLEMELFGTALRPSIEPSLAAAAHGRISLGKLGSFATPQDAFEEIMAIALSHRRHYEPIAQSAAKEVHQWHRESNHFHAELFQTWRRKFQALQRKLGIQPDDEYGRASGADPLDLVGILIAKIYEQALGNILRLDTAAGSFVLEDFPEHFARVVAAAEEVFRLIPLTSARKVRPAASSWMAVVPNVCESLQVASLVCQDEAVRRRAIALLEAHPHRSEVYDSALFVPVARMKHEVEQAGWREDPVASGCCGCRPANDDDAQHVVVCERHRVQQITPAGDNWIRDGRATLLVMTGMDVMRGVPGRRYTVPYATDAPLSKFRWRGFPWGNAASKAAAQPEAAAC